MAESNLTAARLREVLDYDPSTGAFTNRIKRIGAIVGRQTGTVSRYGYTHIRIDGVTYRAHRLAWLYMNGAWPNHQIDHINGVRGDNRIANLRDLPEGLNQQNRRTGKVGSKSGLLGVSACGSK